MGEFLTKQNPPHHPPPPTEHHLSLTRIHVVLLLRLKQLHSWKEQPDCAHTFVTHTRRHTHTPTQIAGRMANPRLTSWCFTHISTIASLTSVALFPLHHRDAEPAQLGEEVPVLQRDAPVPRGHRWRLRPGQETLPEAAAGRLGPTHSGVQHRPQQRENRYVWRRRTSPVFGSGLHGNRC